MADEKREVNPEETKEQPPKKSNKMIFIIAGALVLALAGGFVFSTQVLARKGKDVVKNLIMRFVDVSIHSVEIVKFGEFVKTIPFPSSINIFEMGPLKGYPLFVLEAPLGKRLANLIRMKGCHRC